MNRRVLGRVTIADQIMTRRVLHQLLKWSPTMRESYMIRWIKAAREMDKGSARLPSSKKKKNLLRTQRLQRLVKPINNLTDWFSSYLAKTVYSGDSVLKVFVFSFLESLLGRRIRSRCWKPRVLSGRSVHGPQRKPLSAKSTTPYQLKKRHREGPKARPEFMYSLVGRGFDEARVMFDWGRKWEVKTPMSHSMGASH